MSDSSRNVDHHEVARAIVFAAIGLVGVAVLAVIGFSPIGWLYPTVVYALFVYVAAQEFF